MRLIKEIEIILGALLEHKAEPIMQAIAEAGYMSPYGIKTMIEDGAEKAAVELDKHTINSEGYVNGAVVGVYSRSHAPGEYVHGLKQVPVYYPEAKAIILKHLGVKV